MPVVIPVTEEFGEVGDVNTPAPDTNDQTPLPVTGVLPLSVTVEVQMFELLPAADTVGGMSLIIATVDVDGGQVPLDIVHWKTFVPGDKPVTLEFGEDGVVMAPPPDTRLHNPVPIPGVFPDKVADEEQTVCVVPALDTVGLESLITATVEVDGAQTPLLMVH